MGSGIMRDEGLMLRTACLFSKWGFNDGDLPDSVWDWIEEVGIEYGRIDWHVILRALVREYLLPALAEPVEVFEIETSHNPIRADLDYLSVGGPEYVIVPWDVVFARVRANAEESDLR